jgi:hypothetical protein
VTDDAVEVSAEVFEVIAVETAFGAIEANPAGVVVLPQESRTVN